MEEGRTPGKRRRFLKLESNDPTRRIYKEDAEKTRGSDKANTWRVPKNKPGQAAGGTGDRPVRGKNERFSGEKETGREGRNAKSPSSVSADRKPGPPKERGSRKSADSNTQPFREKKTAAYGGEGRKKPFNREEAPRREKRGGKFGDNTERPSSGAERGRNPIDRKDGTGRDTKDMKPDRSNAKYNASGPRQRYGKSDTDKPGKWGAESDRGRKTRDFGEKRERPGRDESGKKYSDKRADHRNNDERRPAREGKQAYRKSEERRNEPVKQMPEYKPAKQDKAASMPLNKYVAHCGISSRRDAAALIKSGKVQVNGKVLTEPGYKVQPDDKVVYDGKEITSQKNLVYILLNKPKNYLTTTDDPDDRKTVMQLVEDATDERVYPIGRLDRATTGLLLLTNDGDLAQKLSHPKYNIRKLYQVALDKNLSKPDFEKILNGLTLEDGPVTVDAIAYLDKKNEIGIEIHSGRNRIVRRIFEHLGYSVEKLDRVMYAGLTKKNIPRGKWRYLSPQEVINLKYFKQ